MKLNHRLVKKKIKISLYYTSSEIWLIFLTGLRRLEHGHDGGDPVDVPARTEEPGLVVRVEVRVDAVVPANAVVATLEKKIDNLLLGSTGVFYNYMTYPTNTQRVEPNIF